MASVVALSGAIAPGIYRCEGRCDLVLAEVMGPLTAAVGDLRHFRVSFSEAGHSRTRSSLVNATFAIAATSMPQHPHGTNRTIDGNLTSRYPGLVCRRPGPSAAAIAATNVVTVIVTFTTASQ